LLEVAKFSLSLIACILLSLSVSLSVCLYVFFVVFSSYLSLFVCLYVFMYLSNCFPYTCVAILSLLMYLFVSTFLCVCVFCLSLSIYLSLSLSLSFCICFNGLRFGMFFPHLKSQRRAMLRPCLLIKSYKKRNHLMYSCCFYYFIRKSLVSLLEALFARCTEHKLGTRCKLSRFDKI